jgi:hypothetical protein
MKPLPPCKELERALQIVNSAFLCSSQTWSAKSSIPYWLCFGALWAIVQNRGIIPDRDLDICTYYGIPWEPIARGFETHGYQKMKVMIDDTCPAKAVYMNFEHATLPHICVSFWYPNNGLSYYCHDEKHEVAGVGVPASGYWFKGLPTELIDGPERFIMVEYPGIPGSIKIRVPKLPGQFLDNMYPSWAYRTQRYAAHYAVDETKMVSIYRGSATSPYRVWVKSMSQWEDEKYVIEQHSESRKTWIEKLKTQV